MSKQRNAGIHELKRSNKRLKGEACKATRASAAALGGDSVLIEDAGTPGVITELIESVSEPSQWNVDEPGIMIKSPPFGLVFIPVSAFREDPVVLVQRGES